MWKGTNTEGVFPFIPGHEWAGEIVQVGRDVEAFAVGDRVVGEVSTPCGVCRNCKDGMPPELCSAPRLYGFAWQTPGGMAEYQVSETKRWHRVPDNLSDEEAALVEPLSVGYHGIWASGGGVLPHDRAVVFGGGPIGLLTMLICKAAGAWVGMVEPQPYRRQFARDLGADFAVDPADGNLEEQILDNTGGRGASLVVECSGSDGARAATVDVVASAGRIVLIGLGTNRKVPIEVDKAIFKCVSITGSSGAGFDFAKTLAFMSRRLVDFRRVITPRLSLDRVTEAFELGSRQVESGKIMILP
jgi:threonine dehydrogenase-like Zn-dependent dehydrogenase